MSELIKKGVNQKQSTTKAWQTLLNPNKRQVNDAATARDEKMSENKAQEDGTLDQSANPPKDPEGWTGDQKEGNPDLDWLKGSTITELCC